MSVLRSVTWTQEGQNTSRNIQISRTRSAALIHLEELMMHLAAEVDGQGSSSKWKWWGKRNDSPFSCENIDGSLQEHMATTKSRRTAEEAR